jgi:general secretion pathway protein A
VYNEFFGLRSDPFRVNPDPSFLYDSACHREALAVLVYAVQERKGFAVLTGEVGTGKTTLLNAVLAKLPPQVRTAYLFNTRLSVDDFFTYLLDELELPHPEPLRKSTALQLLNTYLIDRLERGLQTLLILDEAQHLSAELLEEIRMLSNLETPQSKLLQILLVGQPELRTTLERADLRQLRQRVELIHHLEPLSVLETVQYVPARLRVAGHRDGNLFEESALHSIYRYTRGIPRVINVLCDGALLAAYSAGEKRVSDARVHEVASELNLSRVKEYPLEPGEPPPVDLAKERARVRDAAPDGGLLRRLWPGLRPLGSGRS